MPTIPDEAKALYFGGISLISDPAAAFYTALAQREAADRVIVVDPNIRPGFITDTAAYRARLDRMFACADIVKVSDEDLDWILPGPGTQHDKLAELRARGPGIVILTKGAAGATALTHGNGRLIEVASQPVAVVDTVGAGDTFNAGVLARLAENGCLARQTLNRIDDAILRQALEFGARVAAITVSRVGANPPWSNEVNRAGGRA